jgi:excisionase family DNA binding protein
MTNQSPGRTAVMRLNWRLYTTAEAAAILNVSLRTVQGWIRDGTLPHARLGDGGRLVRIRAQDLEDFIQQLETGMGRTL